MTQSLLGPGSLQLDLEPTSRVLVESGAPAAATPSLRDVAGPATIRGLARPTRLAGRWGRAEARVACPEIGSFLH